MIERYEMMIGMMRETYVSRIEHRQWLQLQLQPQQQQQPQLQLQPAAAHSMFLFERKEERR